MSPATVAALQAALAAEHAAVYGYGAVGAHLTGDAQQTAAVVLDSHRTRRDDLATYIRDLKADPVAASPAYRLPVKPTSSRSAAELAATLETQVMTAYVGLTGVMDAKLRNYGALAMQQAIARSIAWQDRAGSVGTLSAFPGLPTTALIPRPGQ